MNDDGGGNIHRYYNNNPTPFGAILRGDSPARVLGETNDLLAMVDRSPQSIRLHALIIPKRYIGTILDLSFQNAPISSHHHHQEDIVEDVALLYQMRELGLELVQRYQCEDDYRMVFHVPPYNSVDHLHMHVLCNADLSMLGRVKYYYDTRWCISWDTLMQQHSPPPKPPLQQQQQQQQPPPLSEEGKESNVSSE
jgi:diadenosine tetraphosphate (Ap4A) HIT family hydrolase